MFLLFQQSEGGEALWIWLVVILIPVLGRIAGWVLERMGGRSPESGDERAEQRQSRAEARRERAKELERRGQEMWKRLLEGGEAPAEPTPPAAAPPVARPRPATLVRQAEAPLPPGALPHEELPSESAVPTLERKLARALPSASMPEIQELPQHLRSDIQAERDLHADEQLLETGRVDYLESLRERSEAGHGVASVAVSPPQQAADWRRAVLWSEIIGSPVALRDGMERDLPAFR